MTLLQQDTESHSRRNTTNKANPLNIQLQGLAAYDLLKIINNMFTFSTIGG